MRGAREGKLWNEFVARYHYLGYKTLVGAQMRYAVHDRNGWPVAMLGFSTAAWKLAPRDKFIGWTAQLREKNLPLVVDNPRFLILPWIEIPNLGSHILAIVRRRLPEDWTERYNTTPVLIETFVETPRYTGAVYRASGWIHVGTTQGRGRYDRDKQYDKPKKDIWLRPLRRDWQRTLNRQNLAAVAVCVQAGRQADDPLHGLTERLRSPVAIHVLPGALADPADCLRPCGQALHRLLVQTLEERAPCPDGDQFLGRLLDSSLKAMELPDAFLAGGRIRDLLHPYMGVRPRPGFLDCTHPVRLPRVACGLSQQSPQIGTRAVQLLDKDVVACQTYLLRSNSFTRAPGSAIGVDVARIHRFSQGCQARVNGPVSAFQNRLEDFLQVCPGASRSSSRQLGGNGPEPCLPLVWRRQRSSLPRERSGDRRCEVRVEEPEETAQLVRQVLGESNGLLPAWQRGQDIRPHPCELVDVSIQVEVRDNARQSFDAIGPPAVDETRLLDIRGLLHDPWRKDSDASTATAPEVGPALHSIRTQAVSWYLGGKFNARRANLSQQCGCIAEHSLGFGCEVIPRGHPAYKKIRQNFFCRISQHAGRLGDKILKGHERRAKRTERCR